MGTHYVNIITTLVLSRYHILPMKRWTGAGRYYKNLYNKYLKIAWPATLQGLMMQLMTAIDLAMVGSLGASALASVGIMGQPEMVMLVIAGPYRLQSPQLLPAVMVKVGCRWHECSAQAIHTTELLIYIPLLAMCLFNLEHILRFTGAEDGYIETAVWYGRFIVMSLVFQSFSQIVGGALIGYGNTKVIFKPMWWGIS